VNTAPPPVNEIEEDVRWRCSSSTARVFRDHALHESATLRTLIDQDFASRPLHSPSSAASGTCHGRPAGRARGDGPRVDQQGEERSG